MKILIPKNKNFIINLILQRTGPFLKLGGRESLNRWMKTNQRSQLFDFLASNSLLDTYIELVIQDISKEITELKLFLEQKKKCCIVSVGPGNGIAELFLLKTYDVERLYLVDIETNNLHQHGFAETAAGYASLQETIAFLRANDTDHVSISGINPTKQEMPKLTFDYFVSFLSMGFHYPLSSYLNYILDSSVPGSFLIFDKRKNYTDLDLARIFQSFELVSAIPAEKSERLILCAKA